MMCQYFLRNECLNGDKCHYSHGEALTEKGVSPLDPNSRAHMICKMYTQGRCQKGVNCEFAHGEDELRLQKNEEIGKFKTRMCQHFESGYCGRGSNCTYAHDSGELLQKLANRGYRKN